MRAQTLVNRVNILEQKVESLERIPDRLASLELQITQFRDEVRTDFSAVRGEMKALHEIAMTHMRVLHEAIIARIALLDEGRNGRSGFP